MSEEIATPSAVDTNTGATETASTEISETTVNYLPVDDYKDYVVPVKVDGEELKVPLAEAISGYQRQADYTRKTQELSQQREQMQFAAAIQQALERDPAATIDLLSRHYGISRAQAAEMAAEVEDTESLDPAERKMRELESKVAQFEEYQSQQQWEREIAKLQSKYSDFNVSEVVGTAIRTNSTDLEGIYKQMAYDKFVSKQRLEQEAAARKQAEEQSVIEAKRQAAVVAGGSNPAASTTNETMEPITNIRDAWGAAKRQLGFNQ